MSYWCGTVGMPLQDLFLLTLREIFAVFNGYDRRTLESWKQVRFLAFVVTSAAGAKNIKRPADLLPLKGDVVWTSEHLIEQIEKSKRPGEDEEVEKIVRWMNVNDRISE